MKCTLVDWLNSYDGNRFELFDHEQSKDNLHLDALDESFADLCMCLMEAIENLV